MRKAHYAIREAGILLVSPDESASNDIRSALFRNGFRCVSIASNAQGALETILTFRGTPYRIRLLFIDYHLPDSGDPHFINELRELEEFSVVVASRRPIQAERDALDSVAVDQIIDIAAPPLILALRIEQSLTRYYYQRILRQSTFKNEKGFIEVLAVIARVLEAKDMVVRDHSENTARLAMSIGSQLGLNLHENRYLGIAGLLHDLGKLAVREDVLNKPGKLTQSEMDEVRWHPVIAATILEPVTELAGTIAAIRHHHERFDGSGYPDGLAGSAIPISARILHLAEAFDMMTTDTPWQKAFKPIDALDEIKRLAGTQFDIDIVNAFSDCMANNRIVDPMDILTLLSEAQR